nr:unnamed protein product [Digitaria exilis]
MFRGLPVDVDRTGESNVSDEEEADNKGEVPVTTALDTQLPAQVGERNPASDLMLFQTNAQQEGPGYSGLQLTPPATALNT